MYTSALSSTRCRFLLGMPLTGTVEAEAERSDMIEGSDERRPGSVGLERKQLSVWGIYTHTPLWRVAYVLMVDEGGCDDLYWTDNMLKRET